jgi:2-iminobutanoate/2-iminopropanoate deaminase
MSLQPQKNLVKLGRVKTENAPVALGPYSQAVEAHFGNYPPLIFVSGQLPIDPVTGEMKTGEIKLLTRQVILNLQGILEAAGSNLHRVVKTEVFLTDLLNDFGGMNEEYAVWFTGQVAPARQTVQVSALPLSSRIEISCIAF